MKEKILKLREEGKTYNEIRNILGCSKSTISYYCGDSQKEKTIKRTKKCRENKILTKTQTFKYCDKAKIKTRHFNKTDYSDNRRIQNDKLVSNFSWKDVLEKFGENTTCYISGTNINLYNDDYSFDHKLAVSKGGDNSLDNLGITHKQVNQMKSDMSIEELLNWCKIILENNGYIVSSIKQIL